MRRVICVAAWFPAIMLLVCTVAVVAGYERAADVERASGNSGADRSPRYLQHDEQSIRPLEEAPARSPDTLAPRLRASEQLASGDEAGNQDGSRRAAPANRELLLPAPPSDARRAGVTNEIPGLATGAASLGLVLGLFIVIVWAVRRGLPKGAGVLPGEVVEVLGRAPLVGKQSVHLLRCGGKLLLVCISPSSVQTLTEVTDPDEVDRLSALCQSKRSAAASFRHALEQFGGKQQPRYLSEDQADELSFGELNPTATHPHAQVG